MPETFPREPGVICHAHGAGAAFARAVVEGRSVLVSERGAGRPGNDDRKFVEAVLWWRRTGVPWRDLPTDFGPWKTVFNRFDRWAKTGKWQRLFLALQTDRDDEWHSVDSTINRAHQHASGGQGGRLCRA